jgi:hypothetical protein
MSDIEVQDPETNSAEAEVPATVDYFAFDETERVMLPDGVQWVEIKKLTEGDRRKYQNAVNRDVRLERRTGDAMLRMAAGDEKHALLTSAIIDFYLFKQGRQVKFGEGTLREFLSSAPPSVIDLIEKAIRKANSWLMADLSVEDIDKQIDELREMRDLKIKEDEGKVTSSAV